ncbi:hypothetical protein N7497_006034 [Penicillium chrysogenum]|uniref:Uncharacterized protein n=1 Tax=Penicillium chrysogenum TaxID=5076 RepID=A0ABQ8WRS3_PENCH|nr:hypothetical protein N7505_003967 [Penicillium chrysogenum]KAJ5285935.1 hypothetical protein N7524_001241 [Penicillium chrysogenum]KAJ6157149.1 hypothetical protein N7497_006034 [Penicillium chrysogenum]
MATSLTSRPCALRGKVYQAKHTCDYTLQCGKKAAADKALRPAGEKDPAFSKLHGLRPKYRWRGVSFSSEQPKERRILLIAKSRYGIGIDPDAGYKFIVFGNNPGRIGGTRLKSSARSGADRTEGQRRTGYIMGGGSGEDPIGSILRQSNAAERMEVELFTRLEDW